MKITVYSLPDCVQCRQTKILLDRYDTPYESVDLSTDEEALKMVQGLGYMSAPVVIAGDEHWSGFRINRIEDIVGKYKSKTHHVI